MLPVVRPDCSHVYRVTLSWQWRLRTSADYSKFAHVQGINQHPNIFHFQEAIGGQLAKLDHKPLNFRYKNDFLFKKWPKLSKCRNSAFQIYSNFLCWKEFSWCILLMPISVEFCETAGTSNCFGEFP